MWSKARGMKGLGGLGSGETAGETRVPQRQHHVRDRAGAGWGGIYWNQIVESLECHAESNVSFGRLQRMN